MSLCRLCSSIQALDLRPVRVRCATLPRGGGYRVQCVAEAGGRSYATRRRTSRSSRSEDDGDEDGEKVRGGRGYWDSNAEGVRRSRGRQQGWNRDEGGRNPGWEPAPGWSMPKKEWDYVDEEKEKRSAETSSQQRWQSSDYDDEYDEEEEEDDDDDDDSDFDLRSLLQDQLFPSLRWGLPISLIILPWLLGNPMMLILGVTAIPPVQKVVGSIVKEIWQTFLDFSGYLSRQRRRGRSGYYTKSSSDEYTEPYSGWGVDTNEPQSYSSRSENFKASKFTDTPYQPMKPSGDKFSEEEQTPIPIVQRISQPRRNSGRTVKMGGWEDLEADRRRRMPVRKEKRPWNLGGRRSSRREKQPWLLKLILAVFPFLRTWGGWLSVLLLFPPLFVLESVNDMLSIP